MGKEMLINKLQDAEESLKNAVNSDIYRGSVSDYNYARRMSAYWLRMRNDAHIALQSVKSSYIAPLRAEKAFCNREGREVALLTSLKDQNTPCGMQLTNSKRVKYVFGGDICEGEMCYFYPVCSEICNIGNKGTPVAAKGKKAKVVVKKAGAAPAKSKGENIPIIKDFSVQGTFTFRFNQAVYTVSGYTNFQEFKKALKAVLPMKKAVEIGMTAGQHQGLCHWNAMGKNLNVPKN